MCSLILRVINKQVEDGMHITLQRLKKPLTRFVYFDAITVW